MVNKIVLTIIVSIILTILIVSLVNVGLSIFLTDLKYEDFCGFFTSGPIIQNNTILCTEDVKNCPDGKTLSRDTKLGCEFPACSDKFRTCQEEFQEALKPYNQIRYYVLALVGFILLMVGLFTKVNTVQLTGLATGGILITEGIVINFQNKIIVFISLILILIIFGIIAYRVIEKKKEN